MISSDQNVENIGQLINELKDYYLLQKEYVQLDVIDKVVRIVSVLLLGIIVFVLTLLVLFYLSFATVHWIEPVVGTGWAFAIVSGFFLLVLVIVVLLRKPLIERPLVKFLSETLMNS
jgi:hypothetical protein